MFTLSFSDDFKRLVQNKFLALRGYRSINVKNYIIFYVIITENTKENE